MTPSLPRTRGRPKGRAITVERRVKLSQPLYDALCRLAAKKGVSVHQLLVRSAACYVERFSGGPINPLG